MLRCRLLSLKKTQNVRYISAQKNSFHISIFGEFLKNVLVTLSTAPQGRVNTTTTLTETHSRRRCFFNIPNSKIDLIGDGNPPVSPVPVQGKIKVFTGKSYSFRPSWNLQLSNMQENIS